MLNQRLSVPSPAVARGTILLLSLCAISYAAFPDSLKPAEYATFTYHSPRGDSLRYAVRVPANFSKTEHLPLLTWMHGWTGNATQGPQYLLINQYYDPDVKQRSVIFEPYAPLDSCWDNKGFGTGTHTDDPQLTNALRMVLELIDIIQLELNLDRSRNYINGGSNGGYATWDLILARPDMFAAAIPFMGGSDPKRAGRIFSQPLWNIHGSADNIVPVSASRDMIKALRLLGSDPSYAEFNYGHDNPYDRLKDTLSTWMFQHSRVPDTTAPSTPTGLTVTPVAGNGALRVQWTASVDQQSTPVGYIVYRNGSRVLTTRSIAFTDSGVTELANFGYRVAAFNPCDAISAKSDSVSARTLADTKAPAVEAARTLSPTVVSVRFTERVARTAAQTAANYQITRVGGGSVTISAAVIQADSMTVRLTTSPLSLDASHVLTVSNITDKALSPNSIVSGTQVSFACLGTGMVLRESWYAVTGSSIADLTASAGFVGAPNAIDTLRTLEVRPSGRLDYGSRIRGYIYPGMSGVYTFWTTSDDASQLFLSPDADSAKKTLVAHADTWMPVREFDYVSSQRSAQVSLLKDTRYYFEVLYKQNNGGENCAVAWQRAGGAPREVIPGENLMCFSSSSVQTRQPSHAPTFRRAPSSQKVNVFTTQGKFLGTRDRLRTMGSRTIAPGAYVVRSVDSRSNGAARKCVNPSH